MNAQVEQAKKGLEALKKKKPVKKAVLKGSPMEMLKAQQEADAKHEAAMQQYDRQVSEAEATVEAWSNVQSLMNERKRAAEEAASATETAPAEATEQAKAEQRGETEAAVERSAEPQQPTVAETESTKQEKATPTPTETAEDKTVESDSHSLANLIRTLYEKGKKYTSRIFSHMYFDVATTPGFMKKYGITGEKFTIRYGVVSRHFGKDSSHYLTESEWAQLPEAIQNPFGITKIKGKDNCYRLYTTLTTDGGKHVVVGVEVKNAGRDLEVNSISTVFGRRGDANLPNNEEVIYTNKEITPEQKSLLSRPNFGQYPTAQGGTGSKDTASMHKSQEAEEKKTENSIHGEGVESNSKCKIRESV